MHYLFSDRKDEKMTEAVFKFLEKQWEDIIQLETDFISYKEFASAVDLQYKNKFETKKERWRHFGMFKQPSEFFLLETYYFFFFFSPHLLSKKNEWNFGNVLKAVFC